MEGVKKNFGFGLMRLPMTGGKVDIEQTCKMVDEFLMAGFNYFDTAHGYIDGMSEKAVRQCISSRHSRDEFILTDKLTNLYFKEEKNIRPFFQSQLEACGVEYFDYYLMHAQSADIFEYFKKARAYETAFALKAAGKVRHVGISFHDKAEVLARILDEYPQVEVVQIQFNYLDYEDPAVESRKCYEVCKSRGIPVIVMEPVKGGALANLSDDAKKVFSDLNALGKGATSAAGYALRFAAGFDGIEMVISGMSDIAQMRDNIETMKDFSPLNENEMEAVWKVRDIIRSLGAIQCTACRYCVAGCPKKILIPDLFACMNAKTIFHDWNADYYYNMVHTARNGKASECVECGKCEAACPQHLEIRRLLKEVAKEFEK